MPLDIEKVKKEAAAPVPPAGEMRLIPARIPFTFEEWDQIRETVVPGGMDEKWLMYVEKDGLFVFRDFVDASFCWKAVFEKRDGGWLLSGIYTLKSNTRGEIFQGDDRQAGFVWYLIEMKIFEKTGNLGWEDFEWPCRRFLEEPEKSDFKKLLETKKWLFGWMEKHREERINAYEKEEKSQWRSDFNHQLLANLQGGFTVRTPFLFGKTARKLMEETGKRNGFLHETAIELGLLDWDETLQYLSKEWEIPVAELSLEKIDRGVCRIMEKDFCRRYLVLPLASADPLSPLPLAMANPINQLILDEVVVKTNCKLLPHLAMPSEISYWLDKVFTETKSKT